MQIDCSAEAPPFRPAQRSDALRWSVSITAALISAIWVGMLTATASQREARLVDLARPDCIHSGVTNKELRHLVRGEMEASTDEKQTVRSVVTICQAKLRGT